MAQSAPVTFDTITPETAERLAAFAAREPLAYADFASIAALSPGEPRVWIACGAGDAVVAAAIDDGLAMSVGGDHAALAALGHHVPGVATKLVIAGRTDEVRAFVGDAAPHRRERHEHFMALRPDQLRVDGDGVPLRIAERADLPLLADVRARALEEEYGMQVDRDGDLYGELERAVHRAVDMQGVAIWVEQEHIAFTAQLIAKTPDAAMFGDLYTDPDLRGAGRATRALAAFCAWLFSESRHVTLRVGIDNERAVRLYERVGFATVDRFMSSLRSDQGGEAL